MNPEQSERLTIGATACWAVTLAAWLAARAYLLWTTPYNLDELSHAHLSWLYTQGWRYLFDDCDIMRSPFLHVMLAPFFRVLGESSLLPYRLLASCASLAAMLVYFWSVRRAARSSSVAAWTCAFAAFTVPSLISAQQIRYEPFMLFFFAMGLHVFLIAEDARRKSALMALSGVLAGIAVAMKIFVAAYLPAFLLLIGAAFRRKTGAAERAAARRGAIGWMVGFLAPFIPLYIFYKPFLDALGADPAALAHGLRGLHASAVLGIENFSALRSFMREPVFWALGFLSLAVVFRRPDRLSRLDLLARCLGAGTLLYLVVLVFLKKQMYLQDMLFPAFCLSAALGRVYENARRTRWALLPRIALVAVGIECIAAASLGPHPQKEERATADRALVRMHERLRLEGNPDRPAEAFADLYKYYDPFIYDDLLTRKEQDSAIRYFNRRVGPQQSALASNSLNVFRLSPRAWVQGNLVLADMGIEFFQRFSTNLPMNVRRFARCLTCTELTDILPGGMEENLARELDRSRPVVVLVDRFMIDLWFRHPDYLEIFNRNYRLRWDDASRRFYAHRSDGAWSGFDTPPRDMSECGEFGTATGKDGA